ncbi:MAG: FeoA family protein [Bdellovibrionota bacterium]
MKKFVLSKIEVPKNHPKQASDEVDLSLVQRLYDLGLHPGLEIEVVSRISFNSVIIIQFGETRIALNSGEFACLHGH